MCSFYWVTLIYKIIVSSLLLTTGPQIAPKGTRTSQDSSTTLNTPITTYWMTTNTMVATIPVTMVTTRCPHPSIGKVQPIKIIIWMKLPKSILFFMITLFLWLLILFITIFFWWLLVFYFVYKKCLIAWLSLLNFTNQKK